MMFMVKAAQKGFATAKPYGDSRRYDFILDVGQRLWRVQVKSSSAKQYGAYMVNLQRNANGGWCLTMFRRLILWWLMWCLATRGL